MKLNTIVFLMAGHPLRGSINNTPGGEVAVVQMKDVDPETGIQADQFYRVNLTGRKKPDYLRPGDILFVGRGYRIFAVLVEKELKQTVASPHFFMLRVKPETPVRPDYLVWYINQSRAQKYFSRHIAGSALPHINRQTLEDLPVILPPLDIQERIVNAHRCRLKEKALLEMLIEKKKHFLDELLDSTLKHYETHKDSV
jgi:hypothetical protein